MAEWLRRWTANPMCSARVGSNPIHVEQFWIYILPIPKLSFVIHKTEKGLVGGKQSLLQERESQIRTHAQFCCLDCLESRLQFCCLDWETAGGMIPKHLCSLKLVFLYSLFELFGILFCLVLHISPH